MKLSVNCGHGSALSDNSAIRCVLPVLWMTSCFHIMGQVQIQAVDELFTVTRQVALQVKSAILECLVTVALWNRTGHYIFVLWFLSSSFFFFFLP